MSPTLAIPESARRKDESILHLLTHAVRVITDEQAARQYFTANRTPAKAAHEVLRRLEAKGLVMLKRAMAHPEIPLESPILSWNPGDPLPHFGRIAWQLRSRWNQPPRKTLIATATARARTLTNGNVGGRAIRTREATHDIHVTALFLKLAADNRDRAAAWIHEDALATNDTFDLGEKVPDAILALPTPIAIDFGGSYSVQKLASIHRELQHMHFEIW